MEDFLGSKILHVLWVYMKHFEWINLSLQYVQIKFDKEFASVSVYIQLDFTCDLKKQCSMIKSTEEIDIYQV